VAGPKPVGGTPPPGQNRQKRPPVRRRLLVQDSLVHPPRKGAMVPAGSRCFTNAEGRAVVPGCRYVWGGCLPEVGGISRLWRDGLSRAKPPASCPSGSGYHLSGQSDVLPKRPR
jgi:hypothetical protein